MPIALAGSWCALLGCSQKPTLAGCTDDQHLMSITAVDSVSGAVLQTASVITDLGNASVAAGGQMFPVVMNGMRAGLYQVEIQSPGYIIWSRAIAVNSPYSNGCLPSETPVMALMQHSE